MTFTVIIPARLASTRLPNKPLADLGGKPMVVRVAERADLDEAGKKMFDMHTDPKGGTITPNNNPNQYHNNIRWAANHPWIQVSTLKDLLVLALANPASFVVDHGTRTDRGHCF
mgnify:CR=1 FL=1